MGFRFFKRLKLAPGLSLNFSKRGISPSFGVPGARVTVGRRGLTGTVGIPGSGLFYTQTVGVKGSRRRSRRADEGAAEPVAAPRAEQRLELGFFDRLLMPKRAEHFVDGCRAYLEGDAERALGHFERADRNADAAFLAGFLALKAERLEDARRHLERALADADRLGGELDRLGVEIEIHLPLTEGFRAVVGPTRRGALLGLAEVHQLREADGQALAALERLHAEAPDDVVVRLSMAELLLDGVGGAGPEAAARRVVELAGDLDNESEAHAALMLFRGRALARLGLHTAARDVFTAALRRTKDRSERLLTALRYERAVVYEALGRGARARSEFERVYAADPGYADVAERLDLG